MSGPLDEVLRRRVVVVTGKGGVGKSTIAASLALLGAERGKRTLVIDVENKGDAARYLGGGSPRYAPAELMPQLHHLGLEPEDVLQEYLRVALKVPRVYRIGPLRRVFDFIATATPGVREVLIAGKIGFEERAQTRGRPVWDLIIVDAAPSGQVLSHLRGPRTLQELVAVGMIRNQTDWVRAIIEDPEKTGIVVVSLPEEMPVQETAELLEQAPKAVGTPVVALVANRVVARPAPHEALEQLADVPPIALEAAAVLRGLSDNQRAHLARLESLGPPLLTVPLLPVVRHALDSTRDVARYLEKAAA